jgi:hypothetical protein
LLDSGCRKNINSRSELVFPHFQRLLHLDFICHLNFDI